MKDELQRITIAEACGWKWMRRMVEDGEPANWNDHCVWLFTPGHLEGIKCETTPVGRFERCSKPEKHHGFAYGAPNYLWDLNAMHEAEKVLTDTQYAKFTLHLGPLTSQRTREYISATAAQRAEAFLRALNLWTNE